MLKVKNTIALISWVCTAGVASANPPGNTANYPYYANTLGQAQQQGNSQWGPAQWMNQMQNQFGGQNAQDGNIFQDAKGFYKMMGKGNTRYKFYFDFDFQMEMDAWLKGQGNAQNNARQNYNQQQYWNHQGQVAPGYNYYGQGYYQGYVYPQQGYSHQMMPSYYGQPMPQR